MSVVETNPEAQQYSQHPIAALYQRSVLDPMVEVARAISHDFVNRPRHYRAVPENVAGILEGFRIRTGSTPEWPSAPQRAHLFSPIFGDAFRTTSIDLRSAARAFAERGAERTPDPDPLEDRVRDAAVGFRGYLKMIEGRVVAGADRETGPVFRSAIEVFRNEAVAGLFGLPPAPGGNWPLDGALGADVASADGAFLIEEIQRVLGLFYIRPTITQHLFVLLQRIAYYGARTIAGVSEDAADWNGSDWFHNLVRNAYGWETALQSALSYIEDKEKDLRPRVVSQFPLDDEALKSLPTEFERASGVHQAQTGGCGGHWTNIPGTCTYGLTWKCDTGPTCLSGWTYICDTEPTCTYGWTFKCDYHPGIQPRVVSRFALDDAALRSLVTEEEARRAGVQLAQTTGGGPPIVTCTYGWTIRCDSGPTCISGWTQVCDSGPTCTYGWTFKCDKPRASW